MRLVTFVKDAETRIGALVEDDALIVDFKSASGGAFFASMQSLIDGGQKALEQARGLIADKRTADLVDRADCRLLAPLPTPVQIRDCLCFPGHLEGAQRVTAKQMIAAAPDPDAKRAELEAAGFFQVSPKFYEFPLYYITNRMAVYGPDEDIVWPGYSRFIDYELEFAAVIGRAGANIPTEDARDHIFGFSVFNDWSARDEQLKVMGGAVNIGPGAGKDFANSMGPCIVTADEVDDPYRLDMIARVNSEEVSRGSSAGMHFKFEDLIAYLTRAHEIYPGEVICSGTVGGGCAFEAEIQLAPDDVIELEIEGIGVLRNKVRAPHMSEQAGVTEQTIAAASAVLDRR